MPGARKKFAALAREYEAEIVVGYDGLTIAL